MSDSVSSCISSLKYGCRGKRPSVIVKYSVLSLEVCKVLYRDGWISSYSIVSSGVNKGVGINVSFKFFDNKNVLSGIKLFSTPSRSIYISYNRLCHIRNNERATEFYILSTNRGIISSDEAFLYGIGGRILCRLYD